MGQYRVIKNKRVDLVGSDGDFAAEKKCLATLATKIQQCTNDFAAAWLRLHYEVGNHLIVREWMARDKKWLYDPASRTGLRTRCPVDPCSQEMNDKLHAIIAEAHPDCDMKQIQIAIDKLMRSLIKKSGIKSAYPRWMIALSGLGELPQSSRRGMIPFCASDCHISIPATDDGDWNLQVRLGDGSIVMVFKIRTKDYRLHSIRDMLWKIAAKEWDIKGVDLLECDGKWYAQICHSIPKVKLPVDKTKTAFLSGGFDHPILFRLNGKTSCRLRRGNDISYTRKSLTIQRVYKSSKKRNIAFNQREKLARRWRDFVKTWNGHLADEIVRRLRTAGVGRLVVFEPVGDIRDNRHIEKIGRVRDCDIESTRWDWQQMGSLIQKACNKADIDVIIRRVGEHKRKRMAG